MSRTVNIEIGASCQAIQLFIGVTIFSCVDRYGLELSMLMEQEGHTIGFCKIQKLFLDSVGLKGQKIKEGYHNCG